LYLLGDLLVCFLSCIISSASCLLPLYHEPQLEPLEMAEITHHTTASKPRPHILYNIKVSKDDVEQTILRRYSDFVTLHEVLQDPYKLPPKRIITTTFVPSAWADDALIAERKVGLSRYLTSLLRDGSFKDHRSVVNFLQLSSGSDPSNNYAHPEDCLPSTFSRKDALAMKASLLEGTEQDSASADATAAAAKFASYYPDWSAKSPESIDFSKFDIIFYAFATPSSSAGLTLNSGSLLKRLVTAAKNSGRNTKVVLSVGQLPSP
jgi:chitinase